MTDEAELRYDRDREDDPINGIACFVSSRSVRLSLYTGMYLPRNLALYAIHKKAVPIISGLPEPDW
jgi:hypothetical protein